MPQEQFYVWLVVQVVLVHPFLPVKALLGKRGAQVSLEFICPLNVCLWTVGGSQRTQKDHPGT